MKRHAVTLTTAALAVATLAACGGGESPSASGATTPAGDGEFPVTITHALGEAVIEAAPERIVTWGWGATDAVLALGVVPVAIPAMTYGGNDEGVLPWVAAKLADMGVHTPTVLDADTGEVPIEQVFAADPDLILAPYSGLTADEYEALSAVAPVVAYPDQPWATDWQDVISLTAQALGRPADGDAILKDIDATIAAAADAHPEFAGVSVAQVWNTPDSFYVYLPADPRVQLLEGLGFVTAPSVAELDTGEATFYFSLSRERLDELTSDLLVAYAETDEELATFEASAPGQLLAQVQDGKVAGIIGAPMIAAIAPPTALSVAYVLDDYVAVLAEALKQ